MCRAGISTRPSPLGLWSAGRCANKHVIPYIVVQVVAAIAAAGLLYVIAASKPGWVPGGFASNGYGDLSPGKFGLAGCFATEFVLTFFFLFIIIGTTSKGAATGFAGIPIGPCTDSDPPGFHSGDQHVGQSRAQHRACAVRRWRVYRAIMAVLGGADCRGNVGWACGPLDALLQR